MRNAWTRRVAPTLALVGMLAAISLECAEGAPAKVSVPTQVQAAGAITLGNPRTDERATADAKARKDLAHAAGVAAYLFGVPLLVLDDWRVQNLSRLNRIHHWRETATPGFGGSNPNTDTLYSEALLELKPGPLVFAVPDTHGRYYSVQFGDAYLETSNYILRTKFPHGGKFLIAGPDWRGDVPAGLTLVRLLTNEAETQIRIYAANSSEYPQVHALQDQFSLVPLSPGGNSRQAAEPYVPVKGSGKLAQFQRILALMQRNPPDSRYSALVTFFRQVGLDPDKPFDENALDPATRQGLVEAIPDAQDIIRSRATSRLKTNVNGWNVNTKMGVYGDDLLMRAIISVRGFLPNDPRAALYFVTYTDGQGQPFQGKNQYRVRIPSQFMKECHAFWSLTLYDSTFNVLANPINKYSVRSGDHDLQRNADGSINALVQYSKPTDGIENWLPAPDAGLFGLGLRCYEPSREMFDKNKLSQLLPTITRS